MTSSALERLQQRRGREREGTERQRAQTRESTSVLALPPTTCSAVDSTSGQCVGVAKVRVLSLSRETFCGVPGTSRRAPTSKARHGAAQSGMGDVRAGDGSLAKEAGDRGVEKEGRAKKPLGFAATAKGKSGAAKLECVRLRCLPACDPVCLLSDQLSTR